MLEEWRESAPFWAKHAKTVRSMFAPITRALITTASINKGSIVLDIAGGSGEPSLTVAETAEPSSVVCTDAVYEMVLTSQKESRHRGLTNVEFAQCVGEALPFAPNTFDVVISRLGIMLFADPAAALAEVLQAVKPSGRLAFAVWHTSDSNPFFNVVSNVMARYVASPPDDPDAPGAFRFAQPGKLTGLLVEAGATDVSETVFKFSLQAPVTPRQYWELRSELSDTLRTKLAAMSTDNVNQIAQEVEEAARAFYDSDQMRFPAEVVIVSGRK
jgi:SAM-dependent methyltransferase